jgi:hypothetical protein
MFKEEIWPTQITEYERNCGNLALYVDDTFPRK